MITKRNQVLYMALNIAMLGLNVIYTSLLARVLGAELFGRYSVLMNLGFIVAPLTALLPNLILETAHSESKKPVEQTWSSLVLFMLCLSILQIPLVATTLLFSPIIEDKSNLPLFAVLASLFVNPLVVMIQYFYQTYDRYSRFLKLQFAVILIKLGLLGALAMLLTEIKPSTALLVFTIPNVFWVLFSLRELQIWPSLRPQPTFSHWLKKVKKVAAPSVTLSVWASLTNSLDILIAQKNFSSTDLSAYSILSSLSKLSLILPSVITPLILQMGFKKENSALSPRLLIKSVTLTLGAGLLLSVVAHLLAPYLLPLLLNRQFDFQGGTMIFLTLTMTGMASLLFFVNFEFGRKQYAFLWISVVAMACVFTLHFFLPKLDFLEFSAFLALWPVLNLLLVLVYLSLQRKRSI